MYSHPKLSKKSPYGLAKPKKKRGRPTNKEIQERKQADLFLAEKIKAECKRPETLTDDQVIKNYLKAVSMVRHV